MRMLTLFMSGILGAGILYPCIAPSYAADNITVNTLKTINAPISRVSMPSPRVATGLFVEHVNYARVALAMKNPDLAKQHILQARSMVSKIKNMVSKNRRVTGVESGRIVYQYDTEYKDHYFPLRTGPDPRKQSDNNPIWAKNDLVMTDADIVYLTVNLTGDVAETYLDNAENAIAANDLKEANTQLAQLSGMVVTVDSEVSMPIDEARDNIALAGNFIFGKNYDGANYALKHADDALNKMQNSSTYKAHRADILAMRKDIGDMQNYIAQKDLALIQKADRKINKWYMHMKNWPKSE